MSNGQVLPFSPKLGFAGINLGDIFINYKQIALAGTAAVLMLATICPALNSMPSIAASRCIGRIPRNTMSAVATSALLGARLTRLNFAASASDVASERGETTISGASGSDCNPSITAAEIVPVPMNPIRITNSPTEGFSI